MESPDVNLNHVRLDPDFAPMSPTFQFPDMDDIDSDLIDSEQAFDQAFELAQEEPSDQAEDSNYVDEGIFPSLGLTKPVGKYEVKPLPNLAQFSQANRYWHVKSGKTGNFGISFNFHGKNNFSNEII